MKDQHRGFVEDGLRGEFSRIVVDRSIPPLILARAIALVAVSSATTGQAAGGHFAVDDATILEPGMCQLEVWRDSADQIGSLWHVDPACRVGPVELAVNVDLLRVRERPSQTAFGPQVKWAGAIDDRINVGLVASATWRVATPQYVGATLYAPLTAQLSESLRAHFNVGRDWLRDGASFAHAGVALEWQALPAWAVIVERFRQAGGDFARVGAHWQASEAIGFDLSRTRGLGAAAASGRSVSPGRSLPRRPGHSLRHNRSPISEIELKFGIRDRFPGQRRARAAPARGTAHRAIESHYWDSADRRLAKAGLSLRLRKSAGRWEQTVKATGASPAVRLEETVSRPGRSDAGGPSPELSMSAGTDAGRFARRRPGAASWARAATRARPQQRHQSACHSHRGARRRHRDRARPRCRRRR